MRTPSPLNGSSPGRLLTMSSLLGTCLLGLAACGGGAEIRPEVVLNSPTTATAPPADRIVSLQTRTMLAGLACGPAWGDPQAFVRYANFTVRNASVLRRSQHEMAERMGSMSAFDRFHTEISNGESMRMQVLGAISYCTQMREPFYATVAVEPDELDRWALVQQASLQPGN
jgi:hypothetical protein